MRHFLVVFDRIEGRVLRQEEYPERTGALRARFEAERLHRLNEAIEVVVLSASSSEDLRRTHRRYFERAAEIARSGVAQLRPAARETAVLGPVAPKA